MEIYTKNRGNIKEATSLFRRAGILHRKSGVMFGDKDV